MKELGIRLRQVREARKLSQRQLARQCGVSNATISLIENQRSSPSLGILKKILDAIPISLSDFFALDIEAGGAVIYRQTDLTEISRGAVSYRQVGGDLREHKLQIMHERYAPGSDTGRAMLSHDAEEGGIVLSGRLELTVGDQTYVLGPGDGYLFNSRLPHRFRNIGPEECSLVSACTPPSF